MDYIEHTETVKAKGTIINSLNLTMPENLDDYTMGLDITFHKDPGFKYDRFAFKTNFSDTITPYDSFLYKNEYLSHPLRGPYYCSSITTLRESFTFKILNYYTHIPLKFQGKITITVRLVKDKHFMDDDENSI